MLGYYNSKYKMNKVLKNKQKVRDLALQKWFKRPKITQREGESLVNWSVPIQIAWDRMFEEAQYEDNDKLLVQTFLRSLTGTV